MSDQYYEGKAEDRTLFCHLAHQEEVDVDCCICGNKVDVVSGFRSRYYKQEFYTYYHRVGKMFLPNTPYEMCSWCTSKNYLICCSCGKLYKEFIPHSNNDLTRGGYSSWNKPIWPTFCRGKYCRLVYRHLAREIKYKRYTLVNERYKGLFHMGYFGLAGAAVLVGYLGALSKGWVKHEC